MNRNNHQILPFYNSLDEQERNRSYVFGDYLLIGDVRRLLPFQIRTNLSVSQLEALLIDKAGNTIDISGYLNADSNLIKTSEGYSYIVWHEYLLPETIPEGLYYMQVTVIEITGEDSVSETFYSDYLRLVRNPMDKYIRIDYWQDDDFDVNGNKILYGDGYRSALYVDAEIGKPEYPFEEIVTKRDGYEFVEKQISEKIYRFTFLAPEYLCDALRIVRMHDFVSIRYKQWKWDVNKILFTPKWQEEGDLAQMDVEFHTDTIIKKTGKILS